MKDKCKFINSELQQLGFSLDNLKKLKMIILIENNYFDNQACLMLSMFLFLK